MTAKHQAFWEKYNQEKNQHKKLLLMKDYMLSLNAGELVEFMSEPTGSLVKAAEAGQLTAEQCQRLMKILDDFIEQKAPQLA